MPNVGLFTATNLSRRPAGMKYSVEVEGLPVYPESYDTGKLAELKEDNKGGRDMVAAHRERVHLQASSRLEFLPDALPRRVPGLRLRPRDV
jgi:hypothetical protein